MKDTEGRVLGWIIQPNITKNKRKITHNNLYDAAGNVSLYYFYFPVSASLPSLLILPKEYRSWIDEIETHKSSLAIVLPERSIIIYGTDES